MGNPLRFRLALGLSLFALHAHAAIFCPDDRYFMPMQNTLPWGAIGYLNNGCTATLIDPDHILAAAHCFVFPDIGAWQRGPANAGLRFYPNYDPDRPNPPYRTIDRVVVGSRAEGPNFPPPAFPAMDWGLAHLDSPITDFASMSILPAPQLPLAVMNGAYQRDPVIFGSGDEHFNPPPRPPEPDIDPTMPDEPTCGNCWWQPAIIDPACELMTAENHIGLSSCSIQGGSSGSPLFWSVTTQFGTFYFIAASIFGGAIPDFTVVPCDPFACCEAFTLARASAGPVAESFRYAPRQSFGVGLAAQEPPPFGRGKPFTQVFSTDGDEDRVVVRRRNGVSLSDPFREFAPDGMVPSPARIAAFNEPGGQYRLVVTTRTGDLYTREEGGSWSNAVTPPSDLGAPWDVDAVYNLGGTDRIFVTTLNGRVLSRRFTPQRTDWISILPPGTIYRAVSAVEQSNGLTRLFLVSDAGAVFTTAEVFARGGGTTWQTPQPFGAAGLPPLRDIDAAWVDATKRIRIFAVDESGGLWTREAKAPSVSSGWNNWAAFETLLAAPGASGPQPPPQDIATLTASHWSEDTTGGKKQPVLFATDSYGNIYYLKDEIRCTEPENCSLVRVWLSFYHF